MNTRHEVSAGGVAFRIGALGEVEVALIRTHEGRWQLPKGWLEPAESPEDAGRREVREETGIDAEVIAPLDQVRYQYVSRYDPEPVRVRKVVHMFLLRYLGGSTADHDGEVAEARWAPIGEAERMLAFAAERRVVARAATLLAEAGAPS